MKTAKRILVATAKVLGIAFLLLTAAWLGMANPSAAAALGCWNDDEV